MVGALFPWVMVGLMFAASALAFVQIPAGARLPMQWGIRGQVTWRAPPAVALFFAPLLSVLIIGFMTLASAGAGPAGAASAFDLGSAPTAVAFVLVLVHALYVFLVLRDVEEGRSTDAPRRSEREP